SIGGSGLVKVKNPPPGLGEPMYGKLDAKIGGIFMGLNGVKGLEIGLGCEASLKKGSEDNDPIREDGLKTNNSGGILGGISTGEDIDIKVYFKPTPSIFKKQKSIKESGEEVEFSLKGRHDPCIAIRGSVVAEAQAAIVIADALLCDMGRRMDDVRVIYSNRRSFEDFFRSGE
ncbi:MAG: chorismate synthase, partial [Campylobacterales bacterium]